MLVYRLAAEAGPFVDVVATGGMADIVVPSCLTVRSVRPSLTLEGLHIACLKSTGAI